MSRVRAKQFKLTPVTVQLGIAERLTDFQHTGDPAYCSSIYFFSSCEYRLFSLGNRTFSNHKFLYLGTASQVPFENVKPNFMRPPLRVEVGNGPGRNRVEVQAGTASTHYQHRTSLEGKRSFAL